MQAMLFLRTCTLLALLMLSGVLCLEELSQDEFHVPDDEGLLAIKILNRRPLMTRRLPPEQLSFSRGAGVGTQYSKTLLSRKRTLQPSAIKRTPHGSRFSLSLDVPTKILSILIDLAKARDMRAKAAANAELMARIGRRK